MWLHVENRSRATVVTTSASRPCARTLYCSRFAAQLSAYECNTSGKFYLLFALVATSHNPRAQRKILGIRGPYIYFRGAEKIESLRVKSLFSVSRCYDDVLQHTLRLTYVALRDDIYYFGHKHNNFYPFFY